MQIPLRNICLNRRPMTITLAQIQLRFISYIYIENNDPHNVRFIAEHDQLFQSVLSDILDSRTE